MNVKLRGFQWFHFLLFGLAAMRGVSAIGREADAFTYLDDLLATGNREQQACRDFDKEWELFRNQGDDVGDTHPPHKTKEEALKILAMLERRPGAAPSFEKARTYFWENLAQLAREPEQIPLFVRKGMIKGECDPFVLNREYPRLENDIAAFGFGNAEIKRIRSLALTHLKGASAHPSLLETAVRISILKSYLELAYENPGRAEKLKEVERLSASFEDKRQAVYQDAKALPKGAPEISVAGFAFEFQRQKELAAEYSALLHRLKL